MARSNNSVICMANALNQNINVIMYESFQDPSTIFIFKDLETLSEAFNYR